MVATVADPIRLHGFSDVAQDDPSSDPGEAPEPMRASPRDSILIAEDHLDSRDALRTLLHASGYRVTLAATGAEAVEAALASSPDLILMDLMMPEMDGLEATRTLRARKDFRQVPILALTAMEGARERVLAAGCDDYIAKPLDVHAFLEKVESWLGASRA